MGQSTSVTPTPVSTEVQVPIISRVIPNIGDVTGGTHVSIQGAYFESNTAVNLGDNACLNTNFVSSSELTCITPPGSVGSADVRTNNPDGSTYVLTNGYEYVTTALTITGPNAGVNFATAERGQLVYGTCTKNIKTLASSLGTFIDELCDDGKWSLDSYLLTAGANTFTVTGATQDGEGSATGTIVITYDDRVPAITIIEPNFGINFSTRESPQILSGTCSAELVSLHTTLGTFSDSNCNDGSWSLSADLSEGTNDFVISGGDIFGRPASDSLSITYDSIHPTLLITAPNLGADFITDEPSQTLSGSCNADATTLSMSQDGAPIPVTNNCALAGTWTSGVSVLVAGLNTFTVTAFDAVGNETARTLQITYDNATYTLHVTLPNNGVDFSTKDSPQTLSGTCTVGLTGLQTTLGTFSDDDCGDGVWSLNGVDLSEGLNVFTISGSDPYHHTISDPMSITYDSTLPALAITAPNSGSDYTTDQQISSVSGTCDEQASTLTVLHGIVAVPSTNNCSSWTWSSGLFLLNSGLNTIAVTATDGVGNETTRTQHITYDDAAYVMAITAPNGGANFSTNIGSRTVSGTCSAGITDLTTTLGTFSDSDCGDGTWSLDAILAAGANSIQVSGKNPSGSAVSSNTQIITYDTAPPSVAPTSPNGGASFTTNVQVQTITGTCSSDVVNITTSLGSMASNDCATLGTWSLNAFVLSSGANVFTITAYDAAGNTTVGSLTMTYDGVPPSAPVVTGSTPTADLTPTWSWSSGGGGNGTFRYKLDDSDLSTGATETALTEFTPDSNLSVGAHTLYVQERDDAANWSASGSKTVSIENCSTAVTWGRNLSGQLGTNVTLPYVTTPRDVPNLTNVTEIAGGTGSLSVVRKTDGTVWAWGTNDSGQLGDGSVGTRGLPQPVLNLSGISDVAAGSSFAIALKTDGTVWAWGLGTSNQMGDTTATSKVMPVRVSSLSGITKINTTQGSAHSLAIAGDLTAWAWGLNTSGELGDNTKTARTVPIHVLAGANQSLTVSSVSGNATTVTVTTTANHNLATADQVVMTGWTGGTGVWNGTYAITVTGLTTFTYAATGNGTAVGGTASANTWAITPLTVSTVTGNGTTVTVTTTGNHGLTTGDQVVMTGWTGGTGTWTGTYSITVTGLTTFTYAASGNGTAVGGTAIASAYLSNVTDISAGTSHSVALKGDGTVWAWGLGTSGQLGNNAALTSNYPVQVVTALSVNSITGNATTTTVVTNGDHGMTTGQYVVTANWSGGSGTWNGTFAVTVTNSTTFTYLTNGNGTPTGGTAIPALPQPLIDVTAIAAGANFGLAVKTDGTLWSWGLGTNGQLGDNTILSKSFAVQVKSPEAGGWLTDVSTKISAGGTSAGAVKNDGTIWMWGVNTSYQLGDGTVTQRNRPVQLAGITNAASVSVSVDFTLMTTTTNTVMAWGAASMSQLGIEAINQYAPTAVYGFETTPVLDVSTGTAFSLMVRTSDNTVWGFGLNSGYQLGDNTTTQRNTAVELHGLLNAGYLSGIAAVSASTIHALALASDGSVYGWGTNTNGRVGDNTTTTRNYPVQVKGTGGVGVLANITAITTGTATSYALRSDNTVWSWGLGTSGQLGDNTIVSKSAPVQVVGSGGVGFLTDITAISGSNGGSHALALKNDGTVWAWGLNTNGQLGDTTVTLRNAPVQVLNLSDVIAISAGTSHSLAVTGDGTVWAWGLNTSYQLGDGTVTQRNQPVEIIGPTGVTAVSAGGIHSLALKNDGTVWAWGALANNYGYIGDNTAGFIRPFPVQVYGLSHVTEINTGTSQSIARVNCSY
ncbi:MAG: IPT/TIG domain-containing protein [Pseudomonadota bacterium]